MIRLDAKSLLFIEPSEQTSLVIDSLTRRMVAAWRARRDSGPVYFGFHKCKCGAASDTSTHWVMANGTELETSSLCVHYVAMHRREIPTSELVKLEGLTQEELEPTQAELEGIRVVRR